MGMLAQSCDEKSPFDAKADLLSAVPVRMAHSITLSGGSVDAVFGCPGIADINVCESRPQQRTTAVDETMKISAAISNIASQLRAR